MIQKETTSTPVLNMEGMDEAVFQQNLRDILAEQSEKHKSSGWEDAIVLQITALEEKIGKCVEKHSEIKGKIAKLRAEKDKGNNQLTVEDSNNLKDLIIIDEIYTNLSTLYGLANKNVIIPETTRDLNNLWHKILLPMEETFAFLEEILNDNSTLLKGKDLIEVVEMFQAAKVVFDGIGETLEQIHGELLKRLM